MTDDFSNKESILHDKGNVRNLEQLKFPYTNSRIFRGKKNYVPIGYEQSL